MSHYDEVINNIENNLKNSTNKEYLDMMKFSIEQDFFNTTSMPHNEKVLAHLINLLEIIENNPVNS